MKDSKKYILMFVLHLNYQKKQYDLLNGKQLQENAPYKFVVAIRRYMFWKYEKIGMFYMQYDELQSLDKIAFHGSIVCIFIVHYIPAYIDIKYKYRPSCRGKNTEILLHYR